MSDERFRHLHSFNEPEKWLLAHLEVWLDTYLAGRERIQDIVPGTILRPKSWIIKQSFDQLPGEGRTPSVIVVSNGLSEQAKKHGDGGWDAPFRMAVAILCNARESEAARELAGHYQAAALGILLDKPKFGEAKIEDWTDLRIEDVPDNLSRTLCAARLEFTVMVRDFALSGQGPAMPIPPTFPYEPQPDSPVVLKVDVRVNQQYMAPITARAVIQVTGEKTS